MRKAFTLVEMAVVLVILGILMTFIVKGSNLIEAAKVRAEVALIKNANLALSNYLNYQKNIPLVVKSPNTFIDFPSFLKTTGLTAKDFKSIIRDRELGDYFYAPIAMTETADNGFEYAENPLNRSTVYGLYTVTGLETYKTFFPFLDTYCKLELIMDDQSFLTGNMRYYVADSLRFPLDYSNCGAYINEWEDFAVKTEF